MNTVWKYQAVSRTGQETCGSVWGAKAAALQQLEAQGLYVVDIQRDYGYGLRNLRPRHKFSSLELGRLFEDMHNMDCAGMTTMQLLQSLQETTHRKCVAEVFAVLEDRVRQGDSLTEAISQSHVFPWIVPAIIQAGEQTGDLQQSFQILAEYFRRSAEIRSKLAEALVYPAIFFTILIGVMLFVGLRVIPQLQNLLPTQAAGEPLTQVMLNFSFFFQKFWFLMVLVLATLAVLGLSLRIKYQEQFTDWLCNFPVIGRIIKESDMAQYFLSLSILLKSGTALLKAVQDLNALNSSQASRRIFDCREYMFSGMSFWEAVKISKFFPPAVIFALRRGEELACLDEYCSNLAQHLNKRVSLRVNTLLTLIQPVLLLIGGGFLAVLAFAFLVPIYSSLGKIAGG